MQFITQPFGELRLGEFLRGHLSDPQWTGFRAAIAFVKRSGTQYVRDALREFSGRAQVRISVGVDLYGTSREGLSDLLEAAGAGQVFVYRNNGPNTFHPKVYVFKSAERAEVLVGSGNMTGGGLFTNYEASMAASLNLSVAEDATFLRVVEATLDGWSLPQQNLCYVLTPELLAQLVASGLVQSEAQLAEMRQALTAQQQPPTRPNAGDGAALAGTPGFAPPLFATFAVPPAPGVPVTRTPVTAQVTQTAFDEGQAEGIVAAGINDIPTFVVSVLSVDLPVPGSSSEVTITKHIRNTQPGFWGWSAQFTGPDPATGQYRRNVRIRYGNHLINAYLLDFPGRKPDGTKASADFRLGSITPIVADLKQEDDLIVLSRSTEANVDYVAQVVHVSDPKHEDLMDGMQVYSRSRSAQGTYRKFRYTQ